MFQNLYYYDPGKSDETYGGTMLFETRKAAEEHGRCFRPHDYARTRGVFEDAGK